MAQFDVVDMNGKKVSTVELSDAVFGITPNEKAVHEAVVNFLANQRQGTQNTKIRKEVRGGGKKPWRQKGTGPRSPGFHPRSRSGLTAVSLSAPKPPQLLLHHQQEGQASGPAQRPVRQGCQRQPDHRGQDRR